MRKRVEKDPARADYMDFAISPVEDAEGEELEIFTLNEASRAAVAKAKKQTSDREAFERNKKKRALAG